MDNKHINIKFPFQESPKGYLYESNVTTSDSIKSDILHVLLTRKGERFYNPNFGTNLYLYLFEPNDTITISDIISEVNSSLDTCMPNIRVNTITVTPLNNNRVDLKIIAIDTDNVFIEDMEIDVQI